MKIIGKDGKTYETVEECVKAEKAFDEAEEAKEKALAEKKNAVSTRKKEKAAAIQKAEDALNLASTELDKTREDAKKLVEEAQEKARAMIKEASAKYRVASEARYKAISDFNKEFGTYTTTYTGQKALEEYNRAVRHFNDFFDNFVNGCF